MHSTYTVRHSQEQPSSTVRYMMCPRDQQLHEAASGTSLAGGAVTSISIARSVTQSSEGATGVERTGVLCLRDLCLLLHADKLHGDLLEKALHVVTGLCGCLHEHNLELRRLLVGLLERHLSSGRSEYKWVPGFGDLPFVR